MKHLIILFVVLMSNNLVSAQCYIQYTYDTSGNRIKREYVGGCAKPASKNDVEDVVKTAISDSIIGVRTEIIRNDIENKIKVYPNPTNDMVNILLDDIELNCVYTITSIAGYQVGQGQIKDHTTFVDLSQYLAGTYILVVRSQDNQIIYTTTIIKQ